MCDLRDRAADADTCPDCAAAGTPPDEDARIGPNSITRIADALRDRRGPVETAALFAAAGLAHHAARPPESMVPAADVTALHGVLRARLDHDTVVAVSRAAGVATADYLLAHRIPKPAQAVLRLLPPVPAARVLIGAMGRHAWTFAGGGRFEGHAGRPTRLVIADGPIQAAVADAEAPVCDYYAATFERLFRVLVARRTRVREVACQAMGAPACVFEADWTRSGDARS
ncbi:bacteriochlorophyll 4-vinyl reductase [Roseospira goensis]|uniref:Divinyl protochlorophyllide a 8-vinyl-reductase n=1 Tax=Roseospira goensis TaxID=391922 RepID=A0A7W6WJA6_9PROT|nr:bacteriochlorophyll 4-vinyl reductase [Roseospira goensis]MBB4284383.1 divinyl protochlorophyllide a 8-vinyl-reductase [Roseospira goensis]